MKSKFILAAILFLTIFNIANSQSNLTTGLSTAQAAAFYFIAKPGEITMQVNVWGFVQKPGRYEIPISTDLVELLSYAGGPMQYADLDEVKIVRMVENTGAPREEIYIDLTDTDEMVADRLKLRNGDTIFLDHTSWVTVRDVFTVVTTAALVTAAISQVIYATRK